MKDTLIQLALASMLLLICHLALSQKKVQAPSVLPVKNGKVVYEAMDSTTLNRDKLHLNAKKWAANSFRSAKDVIQLDDKEGGELIAKGNFSYSYKEFGAINTCEFTLNVSSRDKKYRIQFYDFVLLQGKEPYSTKRPIEEINALAPKYKTYRKAIEAFDIRVSSLLASLKNSIVVNDEF